MKMLYQYSITGEMRFPQEEDHDLFKIVQFDDQSKQYLESVEKLFLEKQEAIDEIISKNSHSWKIDRISKVDLAILRLAILEITELKTPRKVVVNEAVELGKKYSTEKSYQFINGLLGGYLKSCE